MPFRVGLVHAIALFAVLAGLLGLLYSFGTLLYGKVPDDEWHSLRNMSATFAIMTAAGFLLEYYAQQRWGKSSSPSSARGFDVVVRDQQMQEGGRRKP
jgi:uncharacterized protein involved in response to NO